MKLMQGENYVGNIFNHLPDHFYRSCSSFLYKSENESGNRTYSWFSASRSTDQGAAQ